MTRYRRNLNLKKIQLENSAGKVKLELYSSQLSGFRTTVPLVSYIRNSLRFGIMLPLVPVVKILKKNLGHGENLGGSGGQTTSGFC